MGELLRFLKNNPILLVIVLAWVAGAIGNVIKAAKARERHVRKMTEPAERVRRSEPPRIEPKRPAQRSPDEVAAEMRRILGMDVETVPVAPERAPAVVRPKRREVVEPERPPAPALPTT